jgi:hypothetical protein
MARRDTESTSDFADEPEDQADGQRNHDDADPEAGLEDVAGELATRGHHREDEDGQEPDGRIPHIHLALLVARFEPNGA